MSKQTDWKFVLKYFSSFAFFLPILLQRKVKSNLLYPNLTIPEVFDDQLQHNSQRIGIIKFLFCNTAIFCNLFKPVRAFFRKTNTNCNHFAYVICHIFQFTKFFFWNKWQWLILKVFGFHQNRRYEIHSIRGQSFTQPEKEDFFL